MIMVYDVFVALTRFKDLAVRICSSDKLLYGIQEVRGSIPRSSTNLLFVYFKKTLEAIRINVT